METLPAVLAPILFLLLFPLFWCGIAWLLAHLGGWARLGQRFATHQTPRGTPYRWRTGRVGWVSYRTVLQIDVAHDGFFLAMPWLFRVGHPSLFIPWSEVHEVSRSQLLWLPLVRFSVGSPRLARLHLPARLFDGVAVFDAARH